MASELTYESAFPGRFLKAALFEGKRVTVTIEKAYMEVLEGDKGKDNKLILAFTGKTMELVCNKTNALCLKEMFGNKIATWVGKRVVYFPTRVAFGPKQVDAIRVYGSPDIDADIEVSARIGKRNFKTTLVAVKDQRTQPQTATAPASATQTDPRIDAAFEILGWTPTERTTFLGDHAELSQSTVLAKLNALIDASQGGM